LLILHNKLYTNDI